MKVVKTKQDVANFLVEYCGFEATEATELCNMHGETIRNNIGKSVYNVVNSILIPDEDEDEDEFEDEDDEEFDEDEDWDKDDFEDEDEE